MANGVIGRCGKCGSYAFTMQLGSEDFPAWTVACGNPECDEHIDDYYLTRELAIAMWNRDKADGNRA